MKRRLFSTLVLTAATLWIAACPIPSAEIDPTALALLAWATTDHREQPNYSCPSTFLENDSRNGHFITKGERVNAKMRDIDCWFQYKELTGASRTFTLISREGADYDLAVGHEDQYLGTINFYDHICGNPVAVRGCSWGEAVHAGDTSDFVDDVTLNLTAGSVTGIRVKFWDRTPQPKLRTAYDFTLVVE